jgi:hypothetical protein
MGFSCTNFCFFNNAQPFYTVFLSFFQKGQELRFFFLRFRDDELAGNPIRYVIFRAKFYGQAIPFHAMLGFPRIRGIVNARMNDAAVARTGGHSELRKLFDEKDFLPATGQSFRNRATDNTAANDQNVDLVHYSTEYNRSILCKSVFFVAVLIVKALAGFKATFGTVVYGELRAFGSLIAIFPK